MTSARATDERQAAVAYTYAWWLTGGDDAALAVLRDVLDDPDAVQQPGARETNGVDAVALLEGVRARLRDLRPMCPASELALLHDGLGVPLDAAAGLSNVAPDDSRVQLAHGRLEALLETVREDFAHPERLGGLAVANPPDVAHARQCPSCARASTLIERGRAELREVAATSPPPGLLLRLAQAPPPEVAAPPVEAPSEHPGADAAADTVAVHDVLDGPGPYAAAGDAVLEEPTAPGPLPSAGEETASDVAAAPAAPAPEAPPPPPPPTTPPATPRRRVEVSPRRRRAAWVLAVLGLLALFLVVPAVRMTAPERTPAPAPTTADEPAVDSTATPAPTRPTPTATTGFGPPIEGGTEFSIVDAGILLSGETEFAPSGTTITPQDSLRIAVDYRNAADGVPVQARWLVGGESYQRLETVLTSAASRHVWGVPQPAEGWPLGLHRVVIVADGTVVGAVDFTVRPGG